MSLTQILKDNFFKNRIYLFTIFICSIFFLIDLGNLNAIRQGTEGFYLQISKEMFQQNSWLTPLYKGAPHWSKPPVHFWLAQLSYHLFGPSLMAARLTTALTTLIGILFFTHWIHRYFNFSKSLTFLTLATSVGIYKYARIYMMEIPLAIFSVLAVLKYYDFLNLARRRDIVAAIIFLALATLVKGPVAVVMVVGGCTLFTLYLKFWHCGETPQNLISSLIFFTVASQLLAGLWFLACYQNYGMDFINYFFLRENLGKFTAKSYPMSVLFKGLAIYAFPVIMLLPYTLKYLSKNLGQLFSRHPSRPQISLIFVALNFIPFFFLWFIPAQRSHHYAIPSLPLALIFIFITAALHIQNTTNIRQLPYYRILCILGLLLMTLITISIGAIIPLFHYSSMAISPLIIFSAIVAILTLALSLLSKSLLSKLMGYFILFALTWSVVIPSVSLPDISPQAVDLCQDASVSVSLKKFFFISEALGKEVTNIEPGKIIDSLSAGNYVVAELDQLPSDIESYAQVLTTWQVWKRRLHLSTIIERYKQAGLIGLQDTRVLLAPRK